jgi:hypothetical protein
MPTTSNFGWTTPADTDLVKDGAAAIRTLGNGIDTSLVDLKGGTTGQILSKTSNTDLDFTWVTSAGDIEGVTAGTGISGGGTSGTVTITNDMATTITAAGDIVVGTGNATYDNLPIGTTGQVLTADTTVSPYKVKWAAASAPSFVGCSLDSSSGGFSVSTATYTAVSWDLEDFDTDGFHSNTTNNSRITIPSGKNGKYLVNAKITWGDFATGDCIIALYKNGTAIKNMNYKAGAYVSNAVSVLLDLVATDYLQIYVRQSSGSTQDCFNNGVNGHFSVSYQGA